MFFFFLDSALRSIKAQRLRPLSNLKFWFDMCASSSFFNPVHMIIIMTCTAVLSFNVEAAMIAVESWSLQNVRAQSLGVSELIPVSFFCWYIWYIAWWNMISSLMCVVRKATVISPCNGCGNLHLLTNEGLTTCLKGLCFSGQSDLGLLTAVFLFPPMTIFKLTFKTGQHELTRELYLRPCRPFQSAQLLSLKTCSPRPTVCFFATINCIIQFKSA